MMDSLQTSQGKARAKEGEEELSELQMLAMADEGGDALQTVRDFLATQHRVSSEVIGRRFQIPVADRVALSKSEFRGVQNLLTHRVRQTLDAQDVARTNAYRFRAKASQHLDLQASDTWSAERALALLTTESLKMKSNYDETLSQYVQEIVKHQEEARNAEERSAARLRMRAAFASAHVGMRLLRTARGNLSEKKTGLRTSSVRRPSKEVVGGGRMRRSGGVPSATAGKGGAK